jgi:protein fantom
LEEKLKILMESPFFKDYNERATVAAKMKGMENEQIKNATELRNLRDLNARLDTENAIRRQELQEAQTELKKKYEECKEY